MPTIINYLVVNQNHPSFTERWKTFSKKEDAIAHAKSIGFVSMSDIESSIDDSKPGFANQCSIGGNTITIIPLVVA